MKARIETLPEGGGKRLVLEPENDEEAAFFLEPDGNVARALHVTLEDWTQEPYALVELRYAPESELVNLTEAEEEQRFMRWGRV